MKNDCTGYNAPDRLSTREEIFWATGARPELPLQFWLGDDLALEVLISSGDLRHLSAAEVQLLLHLGESGDGVVH